MPFPASSYAHSGRFSEIVPIGRGAAGQVYSALDNLGRRVAVKEALPDAEGFAALRAKFEKEAQLQAALDHPNIVRVHHLEEDPASRELYLIGELADAGSLAELLDHEGPLPADRAVPLILDICAALEETARRGIVHRDVKPSNILLFGAPGGGLTAKLSDFGIAQDARQRKTTMLPGTSHPGTPLYMAPEQADVTVVVDTRADIFALGMTLWELLTGQDYKALMRGGAGPDLATYQPGTSAALGKVIVRAVRPDREERYQTPREFADDLQRLQAGEAPSQATTRLALRRSEQVAPFAWLGTLGPLALTLTLVAVSAGFTALSMGLTSFFTGLTAGATPSAPTALVPATSPPAATPVIAMPGAGPYPAPGQASPVPFVVVPAPPPTNTPSDLIPLPATVAGPSADCVAGSGAVTTEARPVEPFTRVVVHGISFAEVRQGDAEALTVTADANLLPLINSRVENGTLVLSLAVCVRDMTTLRYTITVRDLRAVTAEALGSVSLRDISADELELRAAELGRIEATGAVRSLTIVAERQSAVRAKELLSEAATVRSREMASVEVAARDTLDAQAESMATIIYYGDPIVTKVENGFANVRRAPGP